MIERFRNRSEAGRWLAQRLTHISDEPNPVVLALPRGGVPVGFEIAEHLHVPLDIFIVRKLGVPGHEEYAMGALASGGIIVLNDRVIGQVGLSRSEIDQVVRREQAELERRTREYGKAAAGSNFRGRAVVLVDDGLATGSTMKVAVAAVRKMNPARIVVAVPVAPANARREFERIADQFVTVLEPELFYAVGQYYEDFTQTTDEEVRELLGKQRQALTST